jgi:hypothetical protein
MNMVKIELEVPEDIVKQAETEGYLTNEKYVSWVKDELEKKRHREEAIQYLKEMVAVMREDGEEGPSLEEIDEEVRAYRRQRREMRNREG